MQSFGTILLLLLASAALVLLGHVFRLLRWEQFIRIYEYPQRRSLLRAMAGGYAVNFLLPFHVGDFLRAALAGRKMKTGTGFAFATVIMDRFLDVWVVALLFGGFRLAGLGGAAVLGAARYYLVFALLLAAALLGDPKLLILDEPTAGLDPRERVRLRTLLADMAQDRIILVATHVVSDVESVATKVILLRAGKIVDAAPVPDLIEKHAPGGGLEDVYLNVFGEGDGK